LSVLKNKRDLYFYRDDVFDANFKNNKETFDVNNYNNKNNNNNGRILSKSSDLSKKNKLSIDQVSEQYKNINKQNLVLLLITLAYFLKLTSLSILGVFVIEIIIKLIFDPKFLINPIEIFDTILVLTAFCSNLYCLIRNVDFTHSIPGLITLFRYV